MATLTLRLEIDPVTHKKNVWVKYDSDSDALPQEHEEQHKKLVEALIAGGTVTPEELGTLTIEREGQGAAKAPATEGAPAAREPVATKR
jgi:FtsH ternary system domain X3-analog